MILHQLLGDGAPALLDFPRLEIDSQGAHQGGRIHSGVIEESRILGGQYRIDHRSRDIREPHRATMGPVRVEKSLEHTGLEFEESDPPLALVENRPHPPLGDPQPNHTGRPRAECTRPRHRPQVDLDPVVVPAKRTGRRGDLFDPPIPQRFEFGGEAPVEDAVTDRDPEGSGMESDRGTPTTIAEAHPNRRVEEKQRQTREESRPKRDFPAATHGRSVLRPPLLREHPKPATPGNRTSTRRSGPVEPPPGPATRALHGRWNERVIRIRKVLLPMLGSVP